MRLLPAVLLLAACGGSSVRTAHDPAVSPRVQVFRSYAWLEPTEEPDSARTAAGEAVRRITDRLLQARGFTRTDSVPDFLLGWHLVGDQPVLGATLNMLYPYTWGRWFPGGGVVFGGGFRPEVSPHTVVLDVADGRHRELVWRGQTRVDPDVMRNPARREAHLEEAIADILKRFPPG